MYAYLNRDKVYQRLNNFYNPNKNYRKNKIDKVKAFLYKTQ